MAETDSSGPKGRTLFVRNIAFKTSDEEFAKAFEDYGPIKTSFLVKDKETSKSRGFGYITYSLWDDAEKASKGVKSIDGRRVFVSFADISHKKGHKKGRKRKTSQNEEGNDEAPVKENEEKVPSSPIAEPKVETKASRPKALTAKQERHRAVSTVVLTGLGADATTENIQKLVSELKLKNVREITFPAPEMEDSAALLGCTSNKDAVKAVKKLNGHKKGEKGGKLSAVLLAGEHKKKKEQRPVSEKRCKLIVRNLSFKCDEENLKKAFKAFGNVTDAKIPTKPNGLKIGYAFVQFSTLAECDKAIQAMNAKSIMGRPVAVDWAVEREKFQQVKVKETKPESGDESDDAEDDSGEESESDEVPQTNVKKTKGTKKEVKKQPQQSDSEDDGEESEEEEEGESEEEEEGSDEEAEDEESEEDEEKDSEEEEDDSEEGSSGDESSDEDGTTKRKNKKTGPPRPSDVDQGKTVFIRNVSFDSEEDDLEELFSKFGEIAMCRLVMDPHTEHSKGVAFVKFEQKEDAEKCLLHSDNEQLNPGGVVLDGRKLLVRLAIPREDAKKMKKEKEQNTTKQKDSRNLWLLREGLIRSGTQAAQGLEKQDIMKRQQIERTKRTKLKNPDIFVSPTRLCIHNIPPSVQDAALRKVFIKAANSKTAKITECRIMRDLNRLNASGLGKSQGFGFVCFEKHEHAIAALRETNNNPGLFGEKKRLIVEFSLENRTALRTKQLRLERSQAKLQMLKKEKGGKKKRSGKMSVSVVQAPPTGSKIPKGMPSHMGPKVRHKKRGEVQPNKKQKNVQKPLKRPAQEKASEEPKKKKKRRSNADKMDDIDKLVAKYRNTFKQGQMKKLTGGKWFET